MTPALFARHLAATALCVVPSLALAYPTSSKVSKGCHEDITSLALRNARIDRPAAAGLAPVTRDDEAFLDDQQFDLEPDMVDLGAATLLTGVRYNDLKGRAPNEVDSLAQIHGDPASQQEHCLRGTDQDEPSGTDAALVACRAFIRDKVRDALEGLDASGKPAAAARIDMDVDLAIRGGVTAQLPRYYARMGEALHAVQDGFTHTYRNAAGDKVTVVLNYLEVVAEEHEPTRDGPAHSSELDRCDGDDPLRLRNREMATAASTELLRITLDPALNVDAKMVAVDALLARYFTYEAGCTADNGWCEAPEEDLTAAAGCGCSVPGMGGGVSWWAAGACALGAVFLLRSRAGRTSK